ncbi:MAG TPA: helix-hairpin-helix domain-containing protein [Holophagaceae bacterium]|nr:helix-hairpin-helix domain-containing protein [Holophagaceae bacterium]
MSMRFISTLTTGLAFALALPMAAASHPRAIARESAKDAPQAAVVRVQAPKAGPTVKPIGRHGARHQAARVKAPRSPQRPVDLNTATATELMQLPRIGMGTAERIVAFRKEHGAFTRPEEVMNVKGIGEKSFAKLKPLLLVSVPAR